MKNQEQALMSTTLPIEELARYHQISVENTDIINAEGTLITAENDDIVRFNGYYALNIITGKDKDIKGAFFTIDTNMYVTTDKTTGNSTAKYYLQFILSMDGITSTRVPFKGTFTKINEEEYHLQQLLPITDPNGFSIDLTFTHSSPEESTTAKFTGSITPPSKPQEQVNGATYNNPILSSTYKGTYYNKQEKPLIINGKNKSVISENVILEIGKEQEFDLSYSVDNSGTLEPINSYKFNMNMYVFSFPSPSNNGDMISLVMGTSPASGLVCGDLTTKVGSATKQRTLHTVKAPVKVAKPNVLTTNLSSNKLAPFSAYYPTPTTEYPGAFIAIQAIRIPLVNDIDIYEVTIGVSTDGITSTVYNFDDSMSFDEKKNTLKIPNPAYGIDPKPEGATLPVIPEYIVDISFTRQYVAEGKSGHLIKLEGAIWGQPVITLTPFNLIPLEGFMGATLKDANGNKLVVNNNNEVTYKGISVGISHPQNILYVAIMYILEFTNPAPTNPHPDYEYKVVCSFGTDAEQGLACIVTEYTLQGKKIINEVISYYHSVPKITQSNTSKNNTEKPALA
jgi:hypothetical protein